MCLLGLCAAQWEWQLPRWGPFWHWQSQSTLPAANFQLPASEPGLNNAYNDNNNKDGEMGKMEKTFPRRTRIRFGTRIRIRIRFHFNFTWRLLSFWIYIWFDCLLRFGAVCLFGSASPFDDFTLGKAKGTQIFMRREDNANATAKFDSPFTNE